LFVEDFCSKFLILFVETGASDVDTLPHSIEFSFGRADCGYMASGPNLSDPVTTITQHQIDLHQIAFVHQG
jgi:hypothetical protein